MNKLRYEIGRFMAGRYGTDQLYYALLVFYLILLVLHMIFSKAGVVSLVLHLMTWAVIIFAFYRAFSRNIEKRRAENEAFLSLCGRLGIHLGENSGGRFGSQYVGGNYGGSMGDFAARIRDFPTKKYAKCPHCGATLRLPRKRGKHTVRCPRCGERFAMRIFFGSK